MSKVELTSKEIEDSRYFIKGAQKPELLVLVEDEEDVPFWDKMFGCVNDKYYRIHIHSLQTAPLQANKDGNPLKGTGKENLMNVNPKTLGKSKMIAVDADYDLLIDQPIAGTAGYVVVGNPSCGLRHHSLRCRLHHRHGRTVGQRRDPHRGSRRCPDGHRARLPVLSAAGRM